MAVQRELIHMSARKVFSVIEYLNITETKLLADETRNCVFNAVYLVLLG
jgi:hypothetical protein